MILALCLAGSLTACNRSKSPSANYLTRLANVLEVDVSEFKQSTSPYPSFPKARNLQLSEAKQTISIREFLGLRQCKLHLAIAERNSQIGKLASSSQRLKNDLDILATGPACVAKIDNQSLQEKLVLYLQNKREQLPQRLWHALLGQDEYRQLWQQRGHLQTYPSKLSSNELEQNLSALLNFSERTLGGDFTTNESQFKQIEQTLGEMRLGDAGQLVSELYLLQRNLLQADKIIASRLERKLCLTPQPTIKARYLQNVVNKFFIDEVQAHAVALARRHQQIWPAIERIETRLTPQANKEFKAWIKERDALVDQGLQATLKHAQLLQQLYQQCGLQAGLSAS